MSILRTHWILMAILATAFFVRLGGVFYGLPYHLFGDEETNVYGALKMLELTTLLPVLHWDAFTILYEPPLLAYVYALLFIPTAALLWMFSGFPELQTLQQMLILDPTVFWYVGRTALIALSLGSIYLIYKLGQHFFKQEIVALLCAFFLAFSFFETTLASTTRHWTPGTFFGLLALFLTLKAFESPRRDWYIAGAGLALGCAFGVSYLVFYLPLVAGLVVYKACAASGGINSSSIRLIVREGLYMGIPFVLVAGTMILVHPYPFFVQVINHVVPADTKSISVFLLYYLKVLWNFETPLLIFGVIGLGILALRRNALVILLGLFVLMAGALMYVFLPNIGRYVMPLVPILALLAGYGLFALVELVPIQKKHLLGGLLIVGLVIYNIALYGRYEILIQKGDTRVLAKEWVEEQIPQDATIITHSDRLRLFSKSESLRAQAAIAPESLRAPDRVLADNDTLVARKFSVFALYFVPEEKRQQVLQKALAGEGSVYYVEDTWSKSNPKSLLPPLTPLHQIIGASPQKLDALFIGGDEHHAKGHVLKLLYGTPLLGPDVFIYSIQP